MARGTLTNFTAADFKGLRGGEAKKKPAKKAAAPKPEPAVEDGVPVGSVDEVLEAVGDDKAKAAEVLEAEQAKEKPRKTLVEGLEAVVEGGDEE